MCQRGCIRTWLPFIAREKTRCSTKSPCITWYWSQWLQTKSSHNSVPKPFTAGILVFAGRGVRSLFQSSKGTSGVLAEPAGSFFRGTSSFCWNSVQVGLVPVGLSRNPHCNILIYLPPYLLSSAVHAVWVPGAPTKPVVLGQWVGWRASLPPSPASVGQNLPLAEKQWSGTLSARGMWYTRFSNMLLLRKA